MVNLTRAIAILIAILVIGGALNIISNTEKKSQLPELVAKVKEEGIEAKKFIKAIVTNIIDSDKIEVKYKDKNYKVCFLYLDAPRIATKNLGEQAYGKEAFERTKQMLLKKTVKLVFEKYVWNEEYLLAHVILEDETYFNGFMILNGYGRVEIMKQNTELKDYFYNLQAEAIKNKAGLWELPKDKQPFIKNKDGVYVPK